MLVLGVSYVFILMLSLGMTTLMTGLVLLELLSWMFVSMAEVVSLKYLLIQSYFMILGLLFLAWWMILLSFVFFLKMGMPPFQSWALHVFFLLKKYVFFFMTTFHKVLPLLILVKVLYSFMALMVCFFLMASAILLMPSFVSLFGILGVSSMMHTSWMMLATYSAPSTYLLYWGLYTLLSGMVLTSLVNSLSFFNLSQSSSTSALWLTLSGVPPFLVFWLKMTILVVLVIVLRKSFWLILSVLSMAILVYFRGFSLSKLPMVSFSFLVFPYILMITFFLLF